MSDGLPPTGDFHFVTLEMTSKSHPRSEVMSHDALIIIRPWKTFLLKAPMIYGLAAIDGFYFCDPEMTI